MLRSGLFALECVFSGVFLWLGLYLITHDPAAGEHRTPWWRRPALSVGAALFCVAAYLLGVANQIVIEDRAELARWQRATYMVLPLACAFIFNGIFAVTLPDKPTRWLRRAGDIITLSLLAGGVLLALLGVVTDLFYDYAAIRRVERAPYYLEVPPRYPPYAFIAAFIVSALLAMTFLPLWRYFTAPEPNRRQFRWIAIAGGLNILGAIIGIIGFSLPHLSVPPELGDAFLTIGIIFLGYGVAQHDAILRNRDITRDFSRSLAGAVIVGGAFTLCYAAVNRIFGAVLSTQGFSILVWLGILTVALTPRVAGLLDHLFLPAAAAEARQALASASAQLSVTEEEDLPEAFTGMRREFELRELATRIARDVEGLFFRTNYTREGGGDYISLNTGLLHLAAVEEDATTLMIEEGVSPTVDRQYYQLKAFRQLIDTLIAAMLEDAVTTTQGDTADSDRRKRLLARATILQQQFIQDIPRATVQRTIVRKYGVGDGGGYGRLLAAAKKDLAHRLYLSERRARESQTAA